jgi:aminomethyltransferase
VLVEGVAVGEVSSGNFSPTLGQRIALAFLPPTLELGTEVAVYQRGTSPAGRLVKPRSWAG